MAGENNDAACSEILSLFNKLGITSHPDWMALVLFIRNLVPYFTTPSDKQKQELQRRALMELQSKVFTDARLRSIMRQVENGLELAFRRSIQNEGTDNRAERLAFSALIEEIQAMLAELQGRARTRESWIIAEQDKTLSLVIGDQPKEVVLAGIRGMVRQVIEEFRQDAHMWEERAKVLEQAAMFDPLLSELHNRGAFDAYLEQAVARHHAEAKPMSLMLIDVDHFKIRINDTYGHQVGDDILRTLAKMVKSHADLVKSFAARYGGEEIALILENADVAEAMFHAEAIRMHVADYLFQPTLGKTIMKSEPFHFTVSIGLAELKEGWTPQNLIAAADEALYSAKRAGRNRVMAAM